MKTKTRFLAAQGDILIQQIERLPTSLAPVDAENGRLIVAHGEQTGQHHSFDVTSGMTLFPEDGTGSALFGQPNAPVSLEHQEHTTIVLPPGHYRFIRQRPMQSGVARQVPD